MIREAAVKAGFGDNGGMKTLSSEEKTQYAEWAKKAIATDYQAVHEFKPVGYLPDYVLADPEVRTLQPPGIEIEISDYLLRHGVRKTKAAHGAALSVQNLTDLPARLESARWRFDTGHSNVIGFFEIGDADLIGKAVVQFGYTRKGIKHNAVVTTGIVRRCNIGEYRELLP